MGYIEQHIVWKAHLLNFIFLADFALGEWISCLSLDILQSKAY